MLEFSGGNLKSAGPDLDLVAPFPHSKPTDGAVFNGQFVVRLQAGVSSPELAAAYGARHEFAYPHLDNVNLWSGPPRIPAEHWAIRLRKDPRVVDAYPVYVSPLATRGLMNDPLLPAQWHLDNVGQAGGTPGVDGNAQAAWDQGITGRGVVIGIVDDGLQYTHPDLGVVGLAANTNGGHYVGLASYNFNDNNDDPAPNVATDFHGTAVAGVAAAIGNNGIGGSGVAPDALLGGIRLLAAPTTDIQQANALKWNTSIPNQFDASLIDIYNNSWGPADTGVLQGAGPLLQSALAESTANGRGGLGSIYVWAGGNGRTNNDNVNYDGYANDRHVIAVGAVRDDGTVAPSSEPGAPLLVAAPSGGGRSLTTTDLVGSGGYQGTDYTDQFSGTSAAAPYVSGVVALMLQANPNLTWRDVQHILVQSATLTDPSNPGWVINGGGRHVNADYGFGRINAAGAVNLASNWQPVGPELVVDTGLLPVAAAIPDNNTTGLTRTFTVAPNIRVEHVEVVFNATHPYRGDLQAALTSPSNTQSLLADTRAQDSGANYSAWRFSTTRNWDETSAGAWTLTVKDLAAGNTGTWDSWQILIYGTEITPDTAGPRMTGITDVHGFVNGGAVSSLRVQFNEPIDPATFTAADVSFQQNGTAITVNAVSPVAGSNNTLFDITFASQSTVGEYRLDVGPNIADPAGNLMNQDGDTINGEATQDKYSEFFTLANPFIFSNTTPGAIPDVGGGSLTRTLTLPAVNVGDLNVLLDVAHPTVSQDLQITLEAPDVTPVLIVNNNTGNTASDPSNGYLNTVLDDDNLNAPLINAGSTLLHYTDQFQPSNPLTAFDGNRLAGNWTLTLTDAVTGNTGTFRDFSLVLTPSGIFNIRLDSVTNLDAGPDADRDQIEVAYTITGSDASPFTLGVYSSTNPYFDINSDAQTGTLNVTAAADLTLGSHTLKLSAALFPDPSIFEYRDIYSLVVVDPQHATADYDRFDNYGALSGVTQTPDGTLYIAGDLFSANTITINQSPTAQLNFNGTVVSYPAASINELFLSGGTRADDITVTADVTKTVFAFLGAGNDKYTGGAGTDAVQGGAGHDSITGNDGNDRLYGMIGNDTVLGGNGNDIVNAGDGGIFPGLQAIDGGPGNDLLYVNGTNFNDRITVWDPDGNNAAIGNTLAAVVSNPANPARDSQVLETDGFGYSARLYPFENLDLVAGAPGVFSILDGVNNSSIAVGLSTNTFNFYGTSYTGASSLFVNDNGLITFGSGIGTSANTDLRSSPTQAAIAPLWDNWRTDADNTSDGDRVLGRFDDLNGDGVPDRLVLEWNKVRSINGGSGDVTFQAILQLNTGSLPGAMTFNYPDLALNTTSTSNDGRLASVGIRDSGATQDVRRLLVSQDGIGPGNSFVRSGRAIRLAFEPGVGQTVLITGVETTDRLLVAGGPGDDVLQLENPNIANSRVRLPAFLSGGMGNDTLTDGLGVDTLNGDEGDDVLNSSDGTPGDVLDGGAHVVGDVDFTPEIGDSAFGFEPAWAPLGPAPIANGQAWGALFDNQPDPVSGRIAALAAHPTNPNILYIAAAGGGVWKTTDAGASWKPLTDAQQTLFMGSIALAPSNPNVIYAGTGEANNSGDSFYGRGVLKSTDWGASWTLLGNAQFNRATIAKVVVDPQDANRVYVAVDGFGTNGINQFGVLGIWRSIDGGANWTLVLNPANAPVSGSNPQLSDLVIDPTTTGANGVLYAVFGTTFGDSGNGIYKSTNGGTSWTKLAGGLPTGTSMGRTALAIAASSPSTLYTTIANPSTGAVSRTMKTTDGGSTWANVASTPPNFLGSQGWYDTVLAVDPSNANIVYAGGSYSNFNSNSYDNGMIMTTNGGSSWSDISKGVDGRGLHSDQHGIGFDAFGRLLAGNDGGIWRLDDSATATLRWTNLNANLNTIQFTGVAQHPTNPDLVFGGSQDNGTEEFLGNVAWTRRVGGDGGFVELDAGSSGNGTFTVYHEFNKGSGFLERSTDGGINFTTITTGINTNDPSNFYIPYVFDAAHSGTSTGTGRLLLGTNVVYETTNSGTNWTARSATSSGGWLGSRNIDSVAAAPSDFNTIYAGAGYVHVTSNRGSSWSSVDITPTAPIFLTIPQIVVDPNNSLVAYLVVANFRSEMGTSLKGQVWKTTTGGAAWSPVTGDLPDVPAWSIQRASNGTLYVGTDSGVYVSTNDGTNWTKLGTGLPNVQVVSLRLSPQLNVLTAGTHGRGAWQLFLG